MADISITLELDDSQFQGKLNSVKSQIAGLGGAAPSNLGESIFGGFAAAAGVAVGALAAVGAAMTALAVSGVQAGMEVETLRIRLDALTGSTATGAAALAMANEAALKLPYSLTEISKGIANLVTVSPTLDTLNKRIQQTADIAAVAGLPFDQAAEQIQRALSGGIASAHLFRIQGVSAMMGFRTGVEYSVSETQARIEAFAKSIEGVSEKVNGTLKGAISQLGDQLVRLKQGFAEAVNPALATVFQGIANSMNAVGKEAKTASFEFGVRFVEAGIAVARAIAIVIDNVKGFYLTFEPVFTAAGKLIGVFADVAVRAFGGLLVTIGKFGSAIGYITDALGITNKLQVSMEDLAKNGVGLVTGGMEELKKQFEDGRIAIFANTQGVHSAQDAVEEYAKKIRESIAASRAKREEDAKAVATTPGSTPIGTPKDTAATREAEKIVEALKLKLQLQRDELTLGAQVAEQSEISRKIEETRLKLENDRKQALNSATAIKDDINRNFVIANTNRLYAEQMRVIRDLEIQDYAGKQLAKQKLLSEEEQRATAEFVQSLHDQFAITMATNETEKRLLENRIKLRGDEAKAIDEVLKKYGDEAKLADDIKNIRDQEIAAVRSRYSVKKETTDKEIALDQQQRETFSAGWDTAFNKYKSDAENAAMQSKTFFDDFTKGIEDVIVNFVQTGKLSFTSLANSLIADFARIQAKRLVLGLFGESGGGSSGGSIGSFFSALTGKALGGAVSSNTPYITGESGPELFMPRTSGTIIPNNALSSVGGVTNVNYTINAVDAPSFRQMLAREPEFLYAVTQRGANSIPLGRV